MPTFVVVIVGVLFIALGRWVYERPQMIIPKWSWPRPESQSGEDFARFFGVLGVFVGTQIAVTLINGSLFHGFGDPIFSLGIAFAVTWANFRPWTKFRPRPIKKQAAAAVEAVPKRRPRVLLIVMGFGTALTILHLLIARPHAVIVWIVPAVTILTGWVLVLRVWKRDLVR